MKAVTAMMVMPDGTSIARVIKPIIKPKKERYMPVPQTAILSMLNIFKLYIRSWQK